MHASQEWNEDAAALKAWQKGRTGFPLVDAGMRQLWRTGWMQQSIRMVCAAFLTEYLNIHWLHGCRCGTTRRHMIKLHAQSPERCIGSAQFITCFISVRQARNGKHVLFAYFMLSQCLLVQGSILCVGRARWCWTGFFRNACMPFVVIWKIQLQQDIRALGGGSSLNWGTKSRYGHEKMSCFCAGGSMTRWWTVTWR